MYFDVNIKYAYMWLPDFYSDHLRLKVKYTYQIFILNLNRFINKKIINL